MVSEVKRDLIILTIIGLFFLATAQILSFVSPTFSSPDETANAFFAETFAGQGRLFVFEPLNIYLGDLLFPRSAVSLDGRLTPIGFLGLPLLFGGLIKIFGGWSLTFWTPSFVLLAVLAWYTIIKKIFDRRVGFWSALILLITPAWWYWSARPLMPNILALSFLFFSAFFLIVKPLGTKWSKFFLADYFLAGLMLSGSLWVRTSEIFWLAPLAVCLLIILLKKISWSAFLIFSATLLVSLLPLLFLNKTLYGNYFASGYTATSESVIIETIETVAINVGIEPANQDFVVSTSEFLNEFLPFGFHPRSALKNVWNYGLLMFWWMILPAVIGFWLAWQKGIRWRFFAPLLTVAAILAVVYGSSVIHDNPDPTAFTIGNSYSRYWLPLFVVITPFVALAITRFGDFDFWKKFKKFVPVFCFVLLAGLSANIVFFSSDDALWSMRGRLIESKTIHDRLLELTETDSVIIVDRADKLFFPDRRIRYPLRDETTYAAMPKIVGLAPLYYFGISFPEVDMNYLNDEKLKNLGLRIEFVENFGEESLYRIFSEL